MKTRDEILDILKYSDPKKHWHRVDEKIYYTEDVNLRFEEMEINLGGFGAKWANEPYHDEATRCQYGLYYCSTLVDYFILARVCGARCLLPIPINKELTVESEKYKIAQILDQMGDLDDYMKMSKITVTKD